ncbi:glycerophosphodiester phosphodiesterase family protein, partial [Bacillus velezensis]
SVIIARRSFVMFYKSPLADYKSAVNYVNIKYTRLNRFLISTAHRHGLKVFAWTVRNQKTAEKLQMMAVDGIVTDFPDFISKDG